MGSESETSITRRSLLGSALGAAFYGSALSAQPAEHSPRTRETFDFGWKFFKGDIPGAQMPGVADSSWRPVDLPHDWSIEGPYSKDAPTGGPGGYLPTGIGWYRKRFRLKPPGKVFVEFDGVYEDSEVWINGSYLGKRPYGFISFFYDLTPHLHDGENVIAVRVDNSHQPNSRFYSGSGIYRHTWLLRTNPIHIACWGTYVTTPHISPEATTVRVKTKIRNESPAAQICTLRSEIPGTTGTAEAKQQIAAGDEYEFSQDLQLTNPRLWNLENPYLYSVRSTVQVNGKMIDRYDTPFGVREILFDPDRGFLLNGKHAKINGVCLHHEAGSVGAAVPEAVWVRRFKTLKEMGCNAIRTAHNPPAPEFLDLCDRMGFLVMDEAFDEWRYGKGQIGPYGYSLYFDQWHVRDVTDFVHRDRNHPSVVIWSAGNEIPDQVHADGVQTARELVKLFHDLDPTRPVTAACDNIAAEPKAAPAEFLEALDIVGYNYVDRWRDRREKYYSIDRHRYPRRRFIGTESHGMGGVRGDYQWLLREAKPGFFGFRSSGYLDTEQQWKFVRTYDYVSGDFMWTGIDYLGEARWPRRSASSGVLDTCGFKKDGFYFYQSQWVEKPVLHLFPHWNWKGREGQFLPVMCYTNCDVVELFVNGKSAGKKGFEFPRLGMEGHYGHYPPRARALRTTQDLHLEWDVPYEPGTIKAVGYKNSPVVIQAEITTTGDPAAVALKADRNSIHADRRDVVHITAQIVDSEGRIVPDTDREVVLDIHGEGKLIGVDNGNPLSHEDFKATRRKTFNGLCLAIVQSTNRPGQIQIAASSPGVQPHRVSVTTV